MSYDDAIKKWTFYFISASIGVNFNALALPPQLTRLYWPPRLTPCTCIGVCVCVRRFMLSLRQWKHDCKSNCCIVSVPSHATWQTPWHCRPTESVCVCVSEHSRLWRMSAQRRTMHNALLLLLLSHSTAIHANVNVFEWRLLCIMYVLLAKDFWCASILLLIF